MSFLVQPTLPTRPKTDAVRAASLIFAAILLIMVVAQLFSFEKFSDVITTFSFSNDAVYSRLWAALIVLFEVMALPFLLSMVLSPAARVVSMLSGWLVAAWWFLLSLWIIDSGHGMANSGLLGATLSVMGGWWMVFFCIGLGLLSAWASWGMWPRMIRKE